MSYFSTLSNLYKTYFLSAIVRLLQPICLLFWCAQCLGELLSSRTVRYFRTADASYYSVKAGIEVKYHRLNPEIVPNLKR